ncbi:hypothetical protein EAH78_26190 [Pseudomonas arsenicoxydans]|uniref:Uncharacterized protein n=1 Tax=Pseudomonas arsenicoxydans TaxID=702115 RepID=A0A502HJR3_9PSED|nr:hypothetical protein EAH78_26190 [Pseudomonas arsenicoxydans]
MILQAMADYRIRTVTQVLENSAFSAELGCDTVVLTACLKHMDSRIFEKPYVSSRVHADPRRRIQMPLRRNPCAGHVAHHP